MEGIDLAQNDGIRLVQQAQEALAGGVYYQNLCKVAKIFRRMSLESRWTTPGYVLYKISSAICNNWENRAVTTREVEVVEMKMLPLFLAVLEQLDYDTPVSEINLSLDKIVLGLAELEL